MSETTKDEALRLLREIHAMLKEMRGGEQRAGGDRRQATDADLDGPHGDPILKAKDPRDWSGQSQVGKRMSECPAEYLDLLAERYDYFTGKETDAKKANYNRKDAARARGWAARIRAGYKHPATPAPAADGWDAPKW